MSTDRQQSFIATIGTPNTLLHFLDYIHARPAIVSVSDFSGGFFTGWPQTRDDSHFLGLRADVPVDARPRLTLYFRFTGTAYRLYIRSPGPYYGKCLSMSDQDFFGAYESEGASTFDLINERGIPVTLSAIKSDWSNIYLRPRDEGLLHVQRRIESPYVYIANKGARPLLFNINIKERNAAYLSHPDEV